MVLPYSHYLGHIIGRYYRPIYIRREGNDEPLILKALTMIDPATIWFEIIKYKFNQAATIENISEQTWLCRYLRPIITTHEGRNELLSHTLKTESIENE